jgi:hypothetical protein
MKYVLSVLGLLIIAAGILYLNRDRVFNEVAEPDPVVVSTNADGKGSKLFNYSVRIYGSVRNRGGKGNVVVESTFYQGNDAFTKTQVIYMEADETADYEIRFDEAKLLGRNPKYSVSARAR